MRSAPLIAVSGMAIGVVLSMHTRASLERFGAEAMIPAGLAIALVRETGPLTAGLLVSGRVGAGIGAELGAMKVTEQIDALEAVAVDSFRYWSSPASSRASSRCRSSPRSWISPACRRVPRRDRRHRHVAELYFRRAFSLIDLIDYVPATLKTVVFGFIIGTIACYSGSRPTQGTEGVGRASTRSVVLSSILIIVTNVVLVRLIFFIFPRRRADERRAPPRRTDTPAVRLDGVTKAFGTREVLDDVSLDVATGPASSCSAGAAPGRA